MADSGNRRNTPTVSPHGALPGSGSGANRSRPPAIDRIAVLRAARRCEQEYQSTRLDEPAHVEPTDPEILHMLEYLTADDEIDAGAGQRITIGIARDEVDPRSGRCVDADISPSRKQRSIGAVHIGAADVGQNAGLDCVARQQVLDVAN